MVSEDGICMRLNIFDQKYPVDTNSTPGDIDNAYSTPQTLNVPMSQPWTTLLPIPH